MHLSKHFVPGLLAAVLTLAGAAQAAALTRQPYLQKVGPDTATVAFRLDANCAPQVRFGPNGALNQTAPSAEAGRIHAVELNGLSPGTEYTYVVEACGGQTSPKRFRTAPTPGTRRVHFAAVGDMGTNGTQQKNVARSVLAARPELYVTLGDNAYSDGTEAEFQNNFFAPMAELFAEVPMFTSPGNHEYVTNQAQPYLDNLYMPTNNPKGSERYYSFDWGHVHFVSLDSNCAIGLSSTDRCSLAEMKAWMEQDLAASQQPWKIVFFHHPPWSSGDHGSQLKMRREFVPLFEKHGVDLVLTGHDHNYERTKPMKGEAVAAAGTSGIPYLVVGSGGASLRDWSVSQPAWSETRNNKDYGFLDVLVEEGTLSARMVSPSGTVFDSFTLTKELPPQQEQPPGQPQHALAITVDNAATPQAALFRASTDLPGATVRWDFGDGNSAEGVEATHTYQAPGEYTVTATATSGEATVTSTSQVTVAQSGTVEPDPTPAPAVPGTPTLPDTLPPEDLGQPQAAGCSVAPLSALLPVGLLGLASLLRRRRR